MDIGAVIQEAYHLQKTTPPELNPERMLGSFEPLTKGTYPVFNKYPKFIVDYQVQERERIRQEEIEYLRERSELRLKLIIAKHCSKFNFDNKFVSGASLLSYIVCRYCLIDKIMLSSK